MTVFAWPYHDEDEINAVKSVLNSSRTNYWTGTECRSFEIEYAAWFGTRYAVALMNGTVALEAALHALDIGPGDEVITTCRTFIASASAIVRVGAIPVLADVDFDSQNITAATIAPKITKKTKAIITVHLAGWPCEMDKITALAKQHGLYLIEDCAQAHGAAWQGRLVGAWGDIGAFSFCQDKIITTGGEGGMITLNDVQLWEKIWSLKDHGKNHGLAHEPSTHPGFKWVHHSFGTNWRMTEMQAAIGRAQLKKLSHWLAIRRAHANVFNQMLSTVPALRVTIPPADVVHAYYKYYVFVRPECLKSDWNRDRILKTLQSMHVPCYSGSCSEIYLEKAFSNKNWQPDLRLPIASQLGETSLMLLVHPTISEEAIIQQSQIIMDVMRKASR